MPYRAIMRIVPIVQATHLIGENVALSKKKKISVVDIAGLGVKNIVGTSLIQTEAQLIGLL